MTDIFNSLTDETKHRLFIDKMVIEIGFLAEHCFNAEHEPEICWKKFREQLKHYKNEHIISYLKYLECDAE